MLSNLVTVIVLPLAALRVEADQVPSTISNLTLDDIYYDTLASILKAMSASVIDTCSTLIIGSFQCARAREADADCESRREPGAAVDSAGSPL